MRIYIFAILSTFAGSHVHAQDTGSNKQIMCLMNMNQALQDGFDLNTPQTVWIDNNGVVTINDPESVIKRTTEKGLDSITYKTKKLKFKSYKAGEPLEFEDVIHNVVIKRDEQGRIISLSKILDSESQIKVYNESAKRGFKSPWNTIVKSINAKYAYDNGNCYLDQTSTVEMENPKAKPETKVEYDKAFCDKIMPTVNEIGKEKAGQCANLIQQAENIFQLRANQLSLEGKKFKWLNSDTPTNSLGLGIAINSCVTNETNPYGYPIPTFMMPEVPATPTKTPAESKSKKSTGTR